MIIGHGGNIDMTAKRIGYLPNEIRVVRVGE